MLNKNLWDKMDQNEHSRSSETKEWLLVRIAPLDGGPCKFRLPCDGTSSGWGMTSCAPVILRSTGCTPPFSATTTGSPWTRKCRLGGQLCVLFSEQDRPKAAEGNAQVVPGDGTRRETVHGPPRAADGDQDRERFPADNFRSVPKSSISRPPCRDYRERRLFGVL